MSDSCERFDQVLPVAAARRLSNQIDRVYRGTYGAQTGLRTIVTSVTRQMLRTGSSPAAVAGMLEHYVLSHPTCLGTDSCNVVTSQLTSSMLVELTRQCVAGAAIETQVDRAEQTSRRGLADGP